MAPDETPESRMDELKDLERQRGELWRAPRSVKRDEALDVLSGLQRRLVDVMSRARKKR